MSQQIYFKGIAKTFISTAANQASAYLAKESNWVMSQVYQKISGEAQKSGDIIKTEVAQEKNKVSENIGQKISNYFSGVADSILHPGIPQNCPTPAQTSVKP